MSPTINLKMIAEKKHIINKSNRQKSLRKQGSRKKKAIMLN